MFLIGNNSDKLHLFRFKRILREVMSRNCCLQQVFKRWHRVVKDTSWVVCDVYLKQICAAFVLCLWSYLVGFSKPVWRPLFSFCSPFKHFNGEICLKCSSDRLRHTNQKGNHCFWNHCHKFKAMQHWKRLTNIYCLKNTKLLRLQEVQQMSERTQFWNCWSKLFGLKMCLDSLAPKFKLK